MKEILKSILTRLNNKGTILALASLIISILVQFGLQIDSEKVLGIVQTICTILIALGVLNDPTQNSKAYIPGISDKLVEKKEIVAKEEKSENENPSMIIEQPVTGVMTVEEYINKSDESKEEIKVEEEVK